MTHTELKFLAHEVTKAAAAAIEWSPLNVSPMAREFHTAHLVAAFMKTVADYLTENAIEDTPTE